jgi:hypothetical protein
MMICVTWRLDYDDFVTWMLDYDDQGIAVWGLLVTVARVAVKASSYWDTQGQ